MIPLPIFSAIRNTRNTPMVLQICGVIPLIRRFVRSNSHCGYCGVGRIDNDASKPKTTPSPLTK